MEIRNYTPFIPLFFYSRSPVGRDFGVLVMRGTFSIIPGKTLQPCPDQHPVVETDIYFGEVTKSSVKIESDLAPFKPKSDIHLNAVAQAPRGEPARKWLVRVRVGKLEKYLCVTGPRYWEHHLLGGWKLSESEKCLEVPMRYELAYGGMYQKEQEVVACEYNAVGVGFMDLKYIKHKQPIPAPQIEAPGEPIEKMEHQYKPQGLGPITRAWLPRRKLAGTFDERWKKERWPDLPEDFNYAYYNSAHPDLIYPGYLIGHEKVAVLGLHRHQELAFQLPCYKMAALLRYKNGSMAVTPLVLDTLYLDLAATEQEQHRVYLTWRTIFAVATPIRVIEARLKQFNQTNGGADTDA